MWATRSRLGCTRIWLATKQGQTREQWKFVKELNLVYSLWGRRTAEKRFGFAVGFAGISWTVLYDLCVAVGDTDRQVCFLTHTLPHPGPPHSDNVNESEPVDFCYNGWRYMSLETCHCEVFFPIWAEIVTWRHNFFSNSVSTSTWECL